MFVHRASAILLSAFFALTSLRITSASLFNDTTSSPLDPSLYKDLNVSRGLLYHYYYSPAPPNSNTSSDQAGRKPVILLLHGFPSTSYDWHRQITFFQEQGYGLVVPDMLGYGGTAKPLDATLYRSSLIVRDMVDILDQEGLQEVVVVGHDWGSKISGRLANYFPDRFIAFGFLAIGYTDPAFYVLGQEQFDNLSKTVVGYEQYGYWTFFSADGSDKVIQNHLESFFDLFFEGNSVNVITNFSPTGAVQAWLEANRTSDTDGFITPEDKKIMMAAWRDEGLSAALSWYKISTSSIEKDDDESIPTANLVITKPTFFGAALRDYIGVAASQISSVLQVSQDANTTTIREYNSGHWVQMEASGELNKDLLAWIENL